MTQQQQRLVRSMEKTEVPNVTIVSMGLYPDLFQGMTRNLSEHECTTYDRVFVQDGHLIPHTNGWKTVYGPEQFSYSHNLNLGIKASDPSHDIFILSDDVRFKVRDTVETLRVAAHADPNIGMLSPHIDGGADNILQTCAGHGLVNSNRYLAMACVYLKRKTINEVGLLDEDTFSTGAYGWDDVDYCRQVFTKGLKLAVYYGVSVKHGVERNGTDTFVRGVKGSQAELNKQLTANEALYVRKWGDNKREW